VFLIGIGLTVFSIKLLFELIPGNDNSKARDALTFEICKYPAIERLLPHLRPADPAARLVPCLPPVTDRRPPPPHVDRSTVLLADSRSAVVSARGKPRPVDSDEQSKPPSRLIPHLHFPLARRAMFPREVPRPIHPRFFANGRSGARSPCR